MERVALTLIALLAMQTGSGSAYLVTPDGQYVYGSGGRIAVYPDPDLLGAWDTGPIESIPLKVPCWKNLYIGVVEFRKGETPGSCWAWMLVRLRAAHYNKSRGGICGMEWNRCYENAKEER